MARHRSPRTSAVALTHLVAVAKNLHRPIIGQRSGRRPFQRHPLAAVAATLVAAGIFVGSQPVTMTASAAASDSASDAMPGERSADPAASRADRSAVADPAAVPITVPPAPPNNTAEEVVLAPELSESGSADGPTGSAALGGVPCPTEGFGGVDSHVAQAGYHLLAVFGLSESNVGGLASRPGNSSSDHPLGLALDFMVDGSTGDALAAYAEEHTAELGITYVLWQVPAHYDHVHISFSNQPGSGMTC